MRAKVRFTVTSSPEVSVAAMSRLPYEPVSLGMFSSFRTTSGATQSLRKVSDRIIIEPVRGIQRTVAEGDAQTLCDWATAPDHAARPAQLSAMPPASVGKRAAYVCSISEVEPAARGANSTVYPTALALRWLLRSTCDRLGAHMSAAVQLPLDVSSRLPASGDAAGLRCCQAGGTNLKCGSRNGCSDRSSSRDGVMAERKRSIRPLA